MPITDMEKWNEWEENNTDSYGGACVKVAEEVMRLLDEDDTPLREGYYPDVHTPHGIICKADENVKAGGITGFMAGAVAAMVSQCHSRGEEFRRIWNREQQINDEVDKANEEGGVLNPALLTVKE